MILSNLQRKPKRCGSVQSLSKSRPTSVTFFFFLSLETHPGTGSFLKVCQETVALEIRFIELNPPEIQYYLGILSFSLSDSLFGRTQITHWKLKPSLVF